MVEDRLLERLEVAARLEAELAAQSCRAAPVGVERVGLATHAVEGDHQLLEEVLPIRVLRDQPLELRDKPAMLTELELCIDSGLQRTDNELVEVRSLPFGPRLMSKILQRLPAYGSERVAQSLKRRRRLCIRDGPDGCFESVCVDLAGIHAQRVAALEGLDAAIAEHVAQG